MKTRYCLSIILPLLFCGSLWAQNQTEFLLPMQIAEKRYGENKREDGFTFLLYPYQSNKIDLRDVKRRNPKLVAPDFLELTNLPGIDPYLDKVVLIGVIPNAEQTTDALVVWLAANYNSDRVTVWVDRDTDHDFATEVDVLRVVPGEEARTINVFSRSEHFKQQELTFYLPERNATRKIRGQKFGKIVKGFTLDAQAGVSSGKLNYNYFNTELGFPSWYDVRFTEKSFGASASYNTKWVRLSAAFSFTSSDAYTSQLNIQVDEPQLRVDPNSGREFFVDQIDVKRNLDKHPVNLSQYDLTAALRLHLSAAMELQPFLSVGQTRYRPGEYVVRTTSESIAYQMNPAPYLKLGGRFEFVVADGQAAFIDLAYQMVEWQPQGFFEAIPHTSRDVTHTFFRLMLGYRFGVWPRR